MKGVTAIYLGRIVDKEHFRTNVYAMDGSKKVVDSWDEYEKAMESGLWYSTIEDAKSRVPVEKPKRAKKSRATEFEQAMDELKESEESDDKEPEDMAFEVKKDDFLP